MKTKIPDSLPEGRETNTATCANAYKIKPSQPDIRLSHHAKRNHQTGRCTTRLRGQSVQPHYAIQLRDQQPHNWQPRDRQLRN